MAKRKKKQERSAKKRPRTSGPVFVRHPFTNLPPDVLREGLRKLATNATEEFPKKLAELVAIIDAHDPLLLLSELSAYALFGGMTDAGDFKAFARDRPLTQAQVELVQAVALRNDYTGRQRSHPAPEIMQQIVDLLPEIADAFALQRMSHADNAATDEERATLHLQEHLRGHTQTVRNWGYFQKVFDLSRRLIEPVDEAMRQRIGLKGTELIDVMAHVVHRTERAMTEHWKRLRPVFRAPSLEEAVRRYVESGYCAETTEELLSFAKRSGFGRETFRYVLLSHSNLRLPDPFTFSATEVAAALGIKSECVRQGLAELSLSFGDLAGRHEHYFLLDNPVWARPLIRLTEDQFYSPLPQAFFSFVFPILERLLSGDSDAKRGYEARRASFLEDEVDTLFRSAFPGYPSVCRYRWKDGNQQFENDFLMLVDCCLLIVEAKSASPSWPALRGAPKRAQERVKELLVSPSVQSNRLMQRVWQAIDRPADREELLPKFPVALEGVKSIIRVSVTLEDFAVLQTNLQLAVAAGWVPEKEALAPCILLADLEIVFELLESVAEKLHYLRRRFEVQTSMSFSADELDMLGLYLSTGFNIGELEHGKAFLQLTGMSEQIDKYFMARDHGVEREKPRLRLTKYWRDIISAMEQRRFRQWSEITSVFLNFAFEEQQRAEREFAKIKRNVMKEWRTPGHSCAISIIPSHHRSDALAIAAFRDQDWADRTNRMGKLAVKTFQSKHVKRCVVLAVNIDRADYPYSSVAAFWPAASNNNGTGP